MLKKCIYSAVIITLLLFVACDKKDPIEVEKPDIENTDNQNNTDDSNSDDNNSDGSNSNDNNSDSNNSDDSNSDDSNSDDSNSDDSNSDDSNSDDSNADDNNSDDSNSDDNNSDDNNSDNSNSDGNNSDDSNSDDNNSDDNNSDDNNSDDNNSDSNNSDDNNSDDNNSNTNGDYVPNECHLIAFEFTGQYCPSCPAEAKRMREYKNVYKEKFIYVALHPGARGSKQLYTQEARAYFYKLAYDIKKFTFVGFPSTTYNTLGSYSDNRSKYDMANSESILAFNTKIQHNNETLSVEFGAIACKGKESVVENKKLKVMMWITQNNIKELQYTNKWDENYVHHYIMRGSINGTWGEEYTLGEAYKLDNKNIPKKVFDIDKDAREVYLVVLVLDEESLRVYGAAEYQLTNWE